MTAEPQQREAEQPANASPCANSTSTLMRLCGYIRPHWKVGLLSLILMAAASGLWLYIVWIIKDLVRPIITHASLHELTSITILVFVLAIAHSVCQGLSIYTSNWVGHRVIMDIREQLYHHLLRLSTSFFEDQQTGEIMSRLTNDISILKVIMVVAVSDSVTAPIIIVGGLGALFALSWKLTAVVLLGIPIITTMIRLAGRRMHRVSTQVQEHLADLSDTMQEKLSAIRLIHIFGTEEAERELFSQQNYSTYRKRMRSVQVIALLNPGVQMVSVIGLACALWFGGREVILGRLPAENLFSFVVYVQVIAVRFKKISNIMMAVQQLNAAADRLFEILDEQPQIQDSPNAIPLRDVRGRLEFRDVTFRYDPAGQPVLDHVSFTIEPGETVALAGPSGAGKTTIANLIPRLYDPTSGQVCVDGHDIRSVTLGSLRQHIGIVPQEPILFSGTIHDNIVYGSPEADDETVRWAAQQANAAEFIERLDDGYDTPIGERGVKLSGGQRQRLAIARALLRDPRILILDEATSSLDAGAESLVQEALERLMRDRTTLVIAHRLSTIRHADRILVIEGGRIQEVGSHDELLERDGLYARLYRMQLSPTRGDHVLSRP